MVLIEKIVMKNCRLCHDKPGLHELHSDKKLIKNIYECVKIKVNDKSMNLLPRLICDECKSNINNFSTFKQQLKRVDQSLRKLLKNFDIQVKSEEHFQCTECPAEFNSTEVFVKHLNSHANTDLNDGNLETDISCTTCKSIFKNLDEYGVHKCTLNLDLTESENSSSNVDVNQDENYDLGNLSEKCIEQKKVKKSEAKYICNYKNCKKVLSSAYTLKTHQLKHQGNRSFLCVTCGKGFITKNSLLCHEKIHLEVKGYICKLCNLGFSVRSNLRAHEKKYHEGVRFYCSQCTRAFSSKCSLERHERLHTGIKDFKCNSCPSAFYTRKELLKHQRYHQGLRLHKCDECFKTFYERHHLIIHLRSHTGERPYVCKFPNCGKSFTESQKLKRHHNAKHAQV